MEQGKWFTSAGWWLCGADPALAWERWYFFSEKVSSLGFTTWSLGSMPAWGALVPLFGFGIHDMGSSVHGIGFGVRGSGSIPVWGALVPLVRVWYPAY